MTVEQKHVISKLVAAKTFLLDKCIQLSADLKTVKVSSLGVNNIKLFMLFITGIVKWLTGTFLNSE